LSINIVKRFGLAAPTPRRLLLAITNLILLSTALLLTTSLGFGEDFVRNDIAYDDDHKSQLLDFYPAKTKEPAPVMVHIHGGGWQAGSKPYYIWTISSLNSNPRP
jgi:poly(3-hydroxybutyrate) depolymerase